MKTSLEELLELYSDLERTLRQLGHSTKNTARVGTSKAAIDMRKLVRELSRAKVEVEQRIQNTLLVEGDKLKRRIESATEALPRGRVLPLRRRQRDEDDGAR